MAEYVDDLKPYYFPEIMTNALTPKKLRFSIKAVFPKDGIHI